MSVRAPAAGPVSGSRRTRTGWLQLAPLLALRALLRALPLERAVRLGAWAAARYARLSTRRAEIARINLRIAFPDWSDAEREHVRIASLENLGRAYAETAHLSDVTPESVGRYAVLEGLEHLEAARKRSATGGVIALTGHFGSWELLLAAVSRHGIPFSLVYAPHRNPHVDARMVAWRARAGVRSHARGEAARAVLRDLRAGGIVAMPLDQDAPREEGIFVPFFSEPACTRDAPARIALRTGAPVVPVFLFRQGRSVRHVIRFEPALELVAGAEDRDGAVRENLRRMNVALEEAIRRAPDHWIWSHRRWKTRPPGCPRLYPSRRR